MTYIKIKGIVKSSDDYGPISAATIQIKGTNIKTITNVDGYFEIMVPSTSSIITISFIGYATQMVEIKRNKNSKYRIILNSESNMLGGLGIIRTKKTLLIAGIFNSVKTLFG